MKMIEKDTAEEDGEVDDIVGIDWSETAYQLPEPHLITEKSFNLHMQPFGCYKDYFDFMRGLRETKKNPNKSESTTHQEQLGISIHDSSNTKLNPSSTIEHPSDGPVHKPNTSIQSLDTPVHSADTSVQPQPQPKPQTQPTPLHSAETSVQPQPQPQPTHVNSADTSVQPQPKPLSQTTHVNSADTSVQPQPKPTYVHSADTSAQPQPQHMYSPISNRDQSDTPVHSFNTPADPSSTPVLQLKATTNLSPQFPQVPFQLPLIVPKVNQNTTKYHLALQEPRSSSILPRDRRFYHGFMKNNNKMMEKPENRARMKDLLLKIRSEQEEYQKFLHHCASVNMHNYLYLNENIKNDILRELHDAIQKLVRPPLKSFKHLRVFNLSNMAGPQNPNFTFIRCVCEQGVIPKFRIPDIKGNLSRVPRPPPEKKRGMSEDMVQSMLMTEHGQVYIQQDSLLAIMEAFVLSSREYVLPVKVKEIKINEDQKRTVVVVENPLPRRHVSTRDVNKHYYDNILRSRHENPAHKRAQSVNQPGVPGEDPEGGFSDDDEGNDLSAQLQINLFSLRDLNVLIEVRPGEQEEHSQKKFHVASKCEYQVSLGFEQFSIIDLCQLWWHSKIANTDQIVCTRVDVRNDIIVRNDMYTREQLCPPACPYNPYLFCNHLHHVLKELQQLPPGSYLADHSNGNPTINIHNETEEGPISFETLYRDVLRSRQFIVDNTSPWLPIDTTILPNGFVANEWMACLFSVKNPVKNFNYQDGQGRGRSRGRGRGSSQGRGSGRSRGRGRGKKLHATSNPQHTTDTGLDGNNSRQMTSYESDEF